jgi:phosphogluconate dehydratase
MTLPPPQPANPALHPTVECVTQRIIARSKQTRQRYLDKLGAAQDQREAYRDRLSCGNLAHGFAAAGEDAAPLKGAHTPNIGIISAYNDMLSAHQPLGRYPDILKLAAREVGATAQVAGGVPAMCDGVTQGRLGMELSLFSRDVIALSTAVGLTHAMFDSHLLLGVCDKIVPGLLIGALRFGHIPSILVPAGPMPSGLPNKEKARVRQLYAEGKASRAELLEAEAASYHSPGTCTFYGTANSNQMMMELMGLHMPGSAFINPGTPLRLALTKAAAHQAARISHLGSDYRPIGISVDEKAIVNAIVGLHATGGSTNHALHLPAIARAAGILIDWDDFNDLSSAVPLLTRMYPNGSADVNHFHAAGGFGIVIRELLEAGLAHGDIKPVYGQSLWDYALEPALGDAGLLWQNAPKASLDTEVLRPVNAPFSADGGMRLMQGNLGRGIIKVSAVAQDRWVVRAPARVFNDQDSVLAAFRQGELNSDGVIVVRFQGPRANGMPELHKLTPALGVLQDRGFRVALLTDGRMSGASGKVPAVIHLSPEAMGNGPLSLVQEGDIIHIDAHQGLCQVEADLSKRTPATLPLTLDYHDSLGRELFAFMRHSCGDAETGASAMLDTMGQY